MGHLDGLGIHLHHSDRRDLRRDLVVLCHEKDEIMDAVGTKSKFWYAVGRYLYVPAALILCLVALFMKVAF